jgi:lipopolysaccharide/colanic/teichoic acid biosynthesis glycosyltransferase
VTNPLAKRSYDFLFATLGLLLLSPVFLLIAVWVKLSDGGPVIFLQERVGRYGKRFWIWKFRTMVVGAEKRGPSITKAGDQRVTAVGRFLRKAKLDELPQVWNVLRGEMSFVGPRPEVPHYVARYTPAQREVLNLKPGITDLASLEFRHEEELLRNVPDSEKCYAEYCLPRKIELNLEYQRHANLWQDTQIVLRTVFPFGSHKMTCHKSRPAQQQSF